MEKVTYFDVEYANSQNRSICQIGIVCENFLDGEPYYPELNIYINPEDGFDDNCVRIHGINADKVKDAPNFPTVWKDIEKYFTNAVVIGHNVASSDLGALVKCLRRYNLDIPQMYYICTYDLAKQLVPSYYVSNYKLSTLCEHFGIVIDSEHDAFDDACACGDLFKSFVREYFIDPDNYARKYIPHETKDFSDYVASPVLRKSFSEFYGVIRGFSIDGIITADEIAYIEKWKEQNQQYSNQKDIASVLRAIDGILADGIVTIDEMFELQQAVKSYLDTVVTAPVTLATQILDGILRGITVDGEITEVECKNLRQWLYDNIYLSNHFPFDKTIELVDKILSDGKVTANESAYLTSVIRDMLDPVEVLKEQVNSVEGKHVCLSGNFEYGSKSEIEKYIFERGGIIDSGVKKTTDILMIGALECQAYSHGTYGSKVIKAMEYNEKGCNIQILKESDFFSTMK